MFKTKILFTGSLKIKDIIEINNRIKCQEFQINEIIKSDESMKSVIEFNEFKEFKEFKKFEKFNFKSMLDENEDLLKQIKEKIEIKKEIDKIHDLNGNFLASTVVYGFYLIIGGIFMGIIYEGL